MRIILDNQPCKVNFDPAKIPELSLLVALQTPRFLTSPVKYSLGCKAIKWIASLENENNILNYREFAITKFACIEHLCKILPEYGGFILANGPYFLTTLNDLVKSCPCQFGLLEG